MEFGLSCRQKNLVLSTTGLGMFFIVLTVILRGVLFPSPEDVQMDRVQDTIDQQFVPYAAVIETYAAQNPELALPIHEAKECTHDNLKSLLSPTHPLIAAMEAA